MPSAHASPAYSAGTGGGSSTTEAQKCAHPVLAMLLDLGRARLWVATDTPQVELWVRAAGTVGEVTDGEKVGQVWESCWGRLRRCGCARECGEYGNGGAGRGGSRKGGEARGEGRVTRVSVRLIFAPPSRNRTAEGSSTTTQQGARILILYTRAGPHPIVRSTSLLCYPLPASSLSSCPPQPVPPALGTATPNHSTAAALSPPSPLSALPTSADEAAPLLPAEPAPTAPAGPPSTTPASAPVSLSSATADTAVAQPSAATAPASPAGRTKAAGLARSATVVMKPLYEEPLRVIKGPSRAWLWQATVRWREKREVRGDCPREGGAVEVVGEGNGEREQKGRLKNAQATSGGMFVAFSQCLRALLAHYIYHIRAQGSRVSLPTWSSRTAVTCSRATSLGVSPCGISRGSVSLVGASSASIRPTE